MNRAELVEAMANNSDLTKKDCNAALDAFIEAVNASLKSGEEVRIVGFGTFSTLKRAAMAGRNPRTGEKIKIPASKRPKFKAGKQLVDAVN
jgi:DNA-binding protein HU-beta